MPDSRNGAASTAGFSLVEVLIASSLFVVGIAAMANLTSLGARANAQARTATSAALLATQKVEQLRALAWTFDEAGQPRTDLTANLSVDPPGPEGGVGLTPSPTDALARNLSGYCDFLDAAGRVLAGGDAPPGTAYVRRWSITPVPENPDSTIVLQVIVVRYAASTAATPVDAARIVTLRTRKP